MHFSTTRIMNTCTVMFSFLQQRESSVWCRVGRRRREEGTEGTEGGVRKHRWEAFQASEQV